MKNVDIQEEANKETNRKKAIKRLESPSNTYLEGGETVAHTERRNKIGNMKNWH
jgi:hypothetical protein